MTSVVSIYCNLAIIQKTHTTAGREGSRRNISTPFGMEKLEWCGYPMVKNPRTWQADGRTDRKTDTAWRHRPRLCIASRGKNNTSSLVSDAAMYNKHHHRECAWHHIQRRQSNNVMVIYSHFCIVLPPGVNNNNNIYIYKIITIIMISVSETIGKAPARHRRQTNGQTDKQMDIAIA